MNYLNQFYGLVVYGKEKAVSGFVVGWVAVFVLQHLGYHVSDGLQQAAVATVAGALVHLGVYLKSNNL